VGLLDVMRSWDRRLSDYVTDQRTLTYAQFWGTGNEHLMRGRTASGKQVSLDTALTLPVVQRAFNLMVGDIGPLPIDAFRRVSGRRIEMDPPPWVELPDPANPNFRRPQFVGQCVASLMADGNLFVRAYPNRFAPAFIRIIDPARVTIETTDDGVDIYKVGSATLSAAEVVHVPWMVKAGTSRGVSPIALLAEPIASGLAAMEFGGYFFSNGAAMQGLVEVPAGAQVDAKKLKDDLERGNRGLTKSHAFGVLTGGATFRELTAKPNDSQMTEFLQFVVEDVGRAFGIPPYLLGSQEPGAVAYASTSNARIDYVQHGVQPIVTRIEHALSTLIPGDDTFLRFNLDALLRGDQKARYDAYHVLVQDKVITKDEVRAKEDWGPADEAEGVTTEHGGFLETPNNNTPGGEPAAEPAERAEPVTVTVTSPSVNVTTPPVTVTNFQTPDAVENAERAADLMVADQRDRLGLMEVTLVESAQRVTDFVEERIAQVEERFARAEEQRQADIARLTAIPSVVREVTRRDDNGRVLSVMEKRGDQTVMKLVERDDTGKIVKVTEVAA
jgi:HK97 family phage portal protein